MRQTPNIHDGRRRGWGRSSLVGALLACAVAAVTAGQSPGPPATSQQGPAPQPTFRTAANYVRVDLYATRNGAVVDDLKPEELELREDGVVQKVDAFEYVRVRGATSDAPRVE